MQSGAPSQTPPTSSGIPTHANSLVVPENTLIIIADDLQDNLNIVKTLLTYKGYKVETAKNGKQVLEQVAKHKADLILLDIQMPEMNGFEACRHLKANPETRDIPIIFLTAKADSYDIVDGFKLGAVDYVTKPFNTMELIARVNTHLELKRSRDLLADKNRYLEVIGAGLSKLNNEKNTFIEIAAHDLKNPLSAIKGLADVLRHSNELSPDGISSILENIIKSAERTFSIVRNLLDVSAIEEGNFRFDSAPIDVAVVAGDIVDQYSLQAEQKEITLKLDVPENGQALIRGNSDSLFQVLDNLLSNALKYSPPHSTVVIALKSDGDVVRCTVEDNGVGLSEEDQAKLFGKFARLTPKPTGNEGSTGLGLYIAKKLTEAMNGVIGCRSEQGKGAAFFIEFPAYKIP